MRNTHNTDLNNKTSQSLSNNIELLNGALSYSNDIKVRMLSMEDKSAAIVYIESLTDHQKIERNIITPFMNEGPDHAYEKLTNAELKVSNQVQEIVTSLLQGNSAILMDGDENVILVSTSLQNNRNVEEPGNEKVVRGSHDGFVESMIVNLNLIRKRIENPNLVAKYFTVGKESNTKLAVVYLNHLADPVLVKEVEKRLLSIKSDYIFSPGHLEEFLEKQSLSPFPQFLNTERPDRAFANIMEGRIVILAEGSPTCMVLPVNFFSFYQSPDDFNSRMIVGSFYRLIRIFSFLLAICLPAFYISVVSFHYEILPGALIIPMKASLENIPYNPLIEALIMELTIELIREAGIRLPSPIGQTIGIVGGLVIGDAVVNAGLVSDLMIIIVAVTAISSFVVPSTEMNTSVRVLRFPFMLAAAFLGFFGMIFCAMALAIHLSKLESLGRPYFAPVMPLNIKDFKDAFIRVPVFKQNNRPRDASAQKTKKEWFSRGWKK